jgi:coenzyme F420 biosynthesis associated uncharacterized protein
VNPTPGPIEPSEIPKPQPGWWENVPVLNELYKLLSSRDPVNWELARQVGVALAGEGEVRPADPEGMRRQLEELSRGAELRCEELTGLVPSSVAPVMAVTRGEWVEANLDTLRIVMDPLAEKLTGMGLGIPMPDAAQQVIRQVGGVFMGLQAGFVLGYLAQNVIGQYEAGLPEPGAGRLLYVVSNLEQVESDWELDPQQFRYWIALHEVTHHLQFSRPWVRAYYQSQIRTLISSLDFDPGRLASAIEGFDMFDPERLAATLDNPEALFQAARSPLSEDALAKLQAFMTLVEGYATFVMDAVGAEVLSDHGRLKEVMERRKREASAGDVLLERLIGLELKRRQYEEGVRFCRYVAGLHDVATLNRVWDNPESLPTNAELVAPDTWLARVADAP